MLTARSLFASLVAPEATADSAFDAASIRTWLEQAVGREADDVRDEQVPLRQALTGLCGVSRERLCVYTEAVERLTADIVPAERVQLRNRAILDLAPLALTTAHLLHAMTGPWNCESPYALSCLRIHASDVGAGQPRSGRSEVYLELMRATGLADAGAQLGLTASDPRICDGAFTLPALLMLLGRFPESLGGVVLGANLYLRDMGRFPAAALVSGPEPEAGCEPGAGAAWAALDLGQDPVRLTSGPREDSWLAAQEYVASADERAERDVLLGFLWCRREAEALHDGLVTVLGRWRDPREAAADLVVRRRREAAVYHGDATVGGRSLRSYFAPDQDPFEFLEALAASPYVRAGAPDRSPLVNGLISLRGRMFRIFSPQDVVVLRRWIAALPDQRRLPVGHVRATACWPGGELPTPLEREREREAPVPTYDLRHGYTRLLHRELRPGEREFAIRYVEGWLARSARAVASCPLPRAWTLDGLRPWLHRQHELRSDEFKASGAVTLSEDDLRRDSIGLAPLTLIDGAWLSGHTHPAMATSSAGYALFETFWDELGNGVHLENHPVVYRALVEQMRTPLPPTASAEFVDSQLFEDEHFALPVFWLALGRFPQRYQPEILGMNLAMELSGVGGGYLSTREALRKYGYSTLFVDLHNTIDNVSSGHSAWAADSIDTYLADLPEPERDRAWARVRLGFCTLNPPGDTISRLRERRARKKAAL